MNLSKRDKCSLCYEELTADLPLLVHDVRLLLLVATRP
jgi:hypothetical protein